MEGEAQRQSDSTWMCRVSMDAQGGNLANCARTVKFKAKV